METVQYYTAATGGGRMQGREGEQSRTVFQHRQHHDRELDLNEELVGNKAATYFLRVRGEAMSGAGIHDGDMVVVDRSLAPGNGKVVIALLNGEMLIRRFEKQFNKLRLLPETAKLAPIDIDPGCEDFSIWGVVTYVIHRL